MSSCDNDPKCSEVVHLDKEDLMHFSGDTFIMLRKSDTKYYCGISSSLTTISSELNPNGLITITSILGSSKLKPVPIKS